MSLPSREDDSAEISDNALVNPVAGSSAAGSGSRGGDLRDEVAVTAHSRISERACVVERKR